MKNELTSRESTPNKWDNHHLLTLDMVKTVTELMSCGKRELLTGFGANSRIRTREQLGTCKVGKCHVTKVDCRSDICLSS